MPARPIPIQLLAAVLAIAMASAPSARAQWMENGERICGAAGSQNHVAITSDYNGGAVITWADYRGGSSPAIYAQRIGPDGTPQWSPNGILVCDTTGITFGPTEIPDGAGGAIIFWDVAISNNSRLFAQRMNGSGAAVWARNGVEVCTASGSQGPNFVAVSDLNGGGITDLPGAIVTWEDFRNGNFNDLYAQRLDKSGNRLWGDAGVAVTNAQYFQTFPSIATDGTARLTSPAGAIVAWQDQRNINYDIYATRIGSSGVPQWTTDGVAICTAAGDQLYPKIACVGSNAAVIVWQDYRSGDPDVYAQKIVGGTTSWTADGIPVCTVTGRQDNPVVANVGAGGVIAAWADFRSSPGAIYAQRIDPNGVPQWAANGVPLGAAMNSTYDNYVAILADGAGGAIVAWQDDRGGDRNLYAQRVDANGNVLWVQDGVPVCNVAGLQRFPVMIGDASGTLLAWEDFRGGATSDVYASRLLPSGTVSAPPLEPDGIRIRILSANPVHGAARFTIELPSAARVFADVTDPLGRSVRNLVREELSAGVHTIEWDGRNASGAALPSGLYIARVRVGNRSHTIKLVRVR